MVLPDLIIGAIGSLVATIIWWVLSQFYSFDTRKRIAAQIILLRDDNYSYQKFLEYKDYNLALRQAQRMLEEISEIHSLIRKWTYTPKKKKLINTLLNNLYNLISMFQRYYDGYDNDYEKKVCCEKAQRHLYSVGYGIQNNEKYRNPYDYISVSEVSISLLSDLNYYKKKSIQKILLSSFCFNGNPKKETRKKYYHDLINVNSFLDSHSKEIAYQFEITDKIFTKEQYNKLIDDL